MKSRELFMQESLIEAKKAMDIGEVPIGCVIVMDDQIIARGHNLTKTLKDPTAHAEIIAIRKASKELGNWRLKCTTLYVTIEPCPMCAGAIIQARIPVVVYGAQDEKGGGVHSVFDILNNPKLNHSALVFSGVLEDQCRRLIREFFANKR